MQGVLQPQGWSSPGQQTDMAGNPGRCECPLASAAAAGGAASEDPWALPRSCSGKRQGSRGHLRLVRTSLHLAAAVAAVAAAAAAEAVPPRQTSVLPGYCP